MAKRNLKILISLVLLITIGFGICEIFNIEKKIVNEIDSQNIENSRIPLPSRIIYKNKYNQYIILDSENEYFAKIYSLLYNKMADYEEDKSELMQENISFIECTYIVRKPSKEEKNYIFILGNKNSELEKKIQFYTEDIKAYEFEKAQSYTSKKQVSKVPTDVGFWKQEEGIYKKTVNYNSTEYKSILQELSFNEDIPEINDNYNENVIITISKYEIKNVEANIGSIKYELGEKSDKYFVNCLIYSKVVNDSCIYYNKEGD